MAAKPDTTPRIDDLPIFRGLSEATRGHLLANAVQHTVSAGTVLFRQGEMPTFQLVVLQGSVHLFASSTEGRDVLIETVRPPDLIIPAAIATNAPYLMQARAPEPTRLLMIQAQTFREASAVEPALSQAVVVSLAQQFRRMVRQVKNLKLRTAVERTGCYVLALSNEQGTPDRAILPYEKNLIASELGVTRESFSRALHGLEDGAIRVEGQTIRILDRDRLAAISKPDPLIDGPDRG